MRYGGRMTRAARRRLRSRRHAGGQHDVPRGRGSRSRRLGSAATARVSSCAGVVRPRADLPLSGAKCRRGKPRRARAREESAYRAAYAPHPDHACLYAFLDRLDAAGVKLAIASAAPVENRGLRARAVRTRAGRSSRARHARGRAMRGKPRLRASAAELPACRERCVAFEDAVSGVLGGARAGMAAVGVRIGR